MFRLVGNGGPPRWFEVEPEIRFLLIGFAPLVGEALLMAGFLLEAFLEGLTFPLFGLLERFLLPRHVEVLHGLAAFQLAAPLGLALGNLAPLLIMGRLALPITIGVDLRADQVNTRCLGKEGCEP